MTQSDLVIFTEGISDRFFYDQIASIVCNPLGIRYRIKSGEELTGATGGKQVLLAHFNLLKLERKLRGKKPNRASVFFFLDKDLDDLKGTKIKSFHIAYTSPYHMENYLFMWGDLHHATSAVVGMDVSTVSQIIGDTSHWRQQVATAWKHWVYLCVHASLDGIACGANYHSTSKIHHGCSHKVDMARQAQKEEEIRNVSGLSETDFQTRQNQICHLVDELYAKGDYDCVFKGEWYKNWLATTIGGSSPPKRHKANKIFPAISPALLLTLDFSAQWSEHLRKPLLQIATQHNLSTN